MNCLDSPAEIFVVAWLAFTLLGRVLKAAKRRAPAEPTGETTSQPSSTAGGSVASGEGRPPQIPESMRRWLESIGIDVGEAAGEPVSQPSAERPADAEPETVAARELVADDDVGEGANAEADDGEPEPAWSDRDQQPEEAGEWADARESEFASAAEPRAEAGASEAGVSEAEAFEAGEFVAPAATVLGPALVPIAVPATPAPPARASLATLVRDALVLEAILTPRRQPAPPPARREYGRSFGPSPQRMDD